jgi:hypothetical protein
VRAAWWREKQDEVIDQSRCRVAAHDRSLHAGFTAVHHKTVGVTWLSHKTKTGGSAGGDGIRARQEALKRATHGMIEVLALGGREGPMDARPSDGELHVLTKFPL